MDKEKGKKIIGEQMVKLMKLGFKIADIEKEQRLHRARESFRKKPKQEQAEILKLLDEITSPDSDRFDIDVFKPQCDKKFFDTSEIYPDSVPVMKAWKSKKCGAEFDNTIEPKEEEHEKG